MDVKNTKIERTKRCNEADLEKILREVPVRILGGKNDLKLRAFVGVKDIIYIEPIDGYVLHVRILGEGIEEVKELDRYFVFGYNGRKFSIRYE